MNNNEKSMVLYLVDKALYTLKDMNLSEVVVRRDALLDLQTLKERVMYDKINNSMTQAEERMQEVKKRMGL